MSSGPAPAVAGPRALGRARHVFFDLDGTLADSREGILRCLKHALAAVGRTPPGDAVLERTIGLPLRGVLADLIGEGGSQRADVALAAYRERYRAVGMFESRLYDGVPGCLEALRAGGRSLYVVTAKARGFAEQVLEHFGIRSRFAAVYGPDLQGEALRKGQLIARALALEALDPRDVVMVGDRAEDIEGARANGLAAIAVAWGYGPRQELDAARPELIVEDVPALGAALLGEPTPIRISEPPRRQGRQDSEGAEGGKAG
jgi:phosphoglycolate phosphatase